MSANGDANLTLPFRYRSKTLTQNDNITFLSLFSNT